MVKIYSSFIITWVQNNVFLFFDIKRLKIDFFCCAATVVVDGRVAMQWSGFRWMLMKQGMRYDWLLLQYTYTLIY